MGPGALARLGSVPAAFGGVLIERALGHGQHIESLIQRALGVALIIAAAGLFVRAYLRLAERARHRDATGPPTRQDLHRSSSGPSRQWSSESSAASSSG